MVCLGFLVMFVCEPAPKAPPPAQPYCDVARPVSWSSRDTRETKEAVDAENRKYVRFCRPRG